jgi:hypothetical protein
MKFLRDLTAGRAVMILGVATLLQTTVLAGNEVTFNVYANKLKTANGQPLPTTGLVLLVASTNGTVFGGPTAGAFTSGDDIVLARWDMSTALSSGEFLNSANNLAFFGSWNAGDPLALYWFPTMTLASVGPTNGAPYGFYRDPVGVDGSFPWVTPSAGSTINLDFLTAEAGSSVNLAVAGNASLVVGAISCPNITVSPASLPNGTNGLAYAQVIGTDGSAALPYSFTVTSGGLPAGLSLATNNGALTGTPAAAGSTNFTVTATDTNGCTGTRSYSLVVIAPCPTITVSPVSLPNGTNGLAYAQVIGADGSAALPYSFTVTSGGLPAGLSLATNNGALTGTPAAAGSTNFTVTATDTNGCLGSRSYAITISSFGGPTNRLTVITNGLGTLKFASAGKLGTPTNGALLVVGYNKYKITATPAQNYLFSNWVVSGTSSTYTTNAAVLVFAMSNNLVITANFVTNRFSDATNGWYYGLFWEPNGLTFSNAGAIKFRVKAKPTKQATFSGTLDISGNRKGFAGTFGLDGVGTSKPVDLNKWGHGTPTVRVRLPLDGANATFTGSVSIDGGLWVSEASGYRWLPVGGYAGNYTMVVKGVPADSTNYPGGDGFGLVSIDTNGIIKLAGGKLADGQALAQKVGISPNGEWAFYNRGDSAGSGQFNSFIMGWLKVDPNTGITNINGKVTWLKDPTAVTPMYSRLDMETTVEGSPYFGTDPGATPVLPWTNGVVTYEGAGIAVGSLSNSVTLGTASGKNKFTPADAKALTLALTPKTGKLALTVKNPANPTQKAKGFGVILTNQNGGSGYYVPDWNSTKSGQFKLEDKN